MILISKSCKFTLPQPNKLLPDNKLFYCLVSKAIRIELKLS